MAETNLFYLDPPAMTEAGRVKLGAICCRSATLHAHRASSRGPYSQKAESALNLFLADERQMSDPRNGAMSDVRWHSHFVLGSIAVSRRVQRAE